MKRMKRMFRKVTTKRRCRWDAMRQDGPQVRSYFRTNVDLTQVKNPRKKEENSTLNISTQASFLFQKNKTREREIFEWNQRRFFVSPNSRVFSSFSFSFLFPLFYPQSFSFFFFGGWGKNAKNDDERKKGMKKNDRKIYVNPNLIQVREMKTKDPR